ncbi:hypothetical protein LTR74_011872 [Friedmanniomyces endolithicus]|nr:hypothetical protein LTR74_011872 [Friedmanniomyces endolithicus]
MPATKRPASASSPLPPPKRQAAPPVPSKWKHHPSCTDELLTRCILRAETRNRLGTETASRGFSEKEWRAITSHLNTESTTRFEWMQCRSKFLELRGLWEVWLASHKRVVDKRAPATWKGGRRIRGRWISRVGDTPKNTVELGEVYFEAFEGVEEVGHERLKEQYGRLVKLFGEDLAFGRFAYFVDEISSTGSEREDGADAEEMGSCGEDGEDVGEGSVGEDDDEDVEESSIGEEDGCENVEEGCSIEDDGESLEDSSRVEADREDLDETSCSEVDREARKRQGAVRVGAAIGAQRTATGRLSRSRNAVAARVEQRLGARLDELAASVLTRAKSTITLAIERCQTLPAVRQLSPHDRFALFKAIAQPMNADIILEVDRKVLVVYVQELLLEVKQSREAPVAPPAPPAPGSSTTQSPSTGSAALARYYKLAVSRELPYEDRIILNTAVANLPNPDALVALPERDFVLYLLGLLELTKTSAAGGSSTIAWLPRMLSSSSAVPAPMTPQQEHQQHQQYQRHPNDMYDHHQRPEGYTGAALKQLRQVPVPPSIFGASTQSFSRTAPTDHPYPHYQPSCSDSDRAARERESVAHLCASAEVRGRQEVRPCHSPKAVAARDLGMPDNTVHELPTAVKDPASDPRMTTVSAALARCDTLPAVRELSPDDRIRLLIVVAQPPLPEILAALSDRDLVPYVETLMVRAQQPRSEALPPSAPTGGSKTRMSSAGYGAVTRCANLPAFRALPRADHCLLFPAVARPPHAATVVALSDADLVGYVKALVVSLKQAGAARSSTIAGPLGMLTGDSAATAAAEAVPAAAVVPRLPYQQQQQQQSQPRPNAVYADLQRLEEYTGVGAAALLGASAMAQGERTSLSLLGESWTGQSWARELTEYLWGHFHRDMGCGTVGDGGSSAPAVEAGAVSCRAA